MHSAQKKKTTPSNSHHKAAPFFNQTGEGSFFSESNHHDNQPFQAKFFENRDPIQTKLTMGSVGDKHEVEADQVANKVVANEHATRKPALDNAHPSPFNTIHTSMGQTHGNLALKTNYTPLSISKKETSQSPDLQLDKGDDSDFSDKQPSAQFENKLSVSRGSGSPLPAGTKHQMETGIGANFSQVKVHTGSDAVQMSSEIGARAFTHGNDVYFNSSQYQPGSQEGRHLIAHELTHTVQQGTSVKTQPITSESSAPVVQRSILDRVGSFFSGIRNRVVNFIESIPGFFLFTVLLGRNPLTDVRVDRNGMNFIKGFLLLLPNGQEKYNRLQQEGALDRSAAWIDEQLSTINNIRNDVSDAFSRAVDSLSLSDVARPGRALERIRGYFSPVISRARAFATSIARQVLQFLKDAVLNSLVNFVKERTRAYPLLRVLLARDPITNEEVPRTMENVIHGFLMLTEAGENYYNKMVESGALTRATTWMREQIATLPSASEVMDAFGEAWRSLSFADMLQPIAAFQRIYGILSNPIGRILSFVGAVAMQILIFIKDALLSWLKSNATDIPGYHLLTVILRKDPFTNEVVRRTTTNLIRGFMGLIPGGEQQFQQMQESGVIPRLAGRINDAVDALGFTWGYIRNLFIGLWQSFQIADLMQPLQVFRRIIATFTDPIQRLFNFIRVVITAIIEVLLRMMNFPIDLVGQIIDNAMQAWEDIKRDPIGFLKNLMRAAKKGFEQFFDNFVQHLIGGVTGWLFSELETAGIRPPPDITFRSILGMAMDVLGITTDNIFARLAQKIGQERVDQIRSVMDRLTGIWEFVRDVMDRGAVAIWERIQSQLSNLWDVVVEGIRNWIVTRIVQGVTTRLLSMLDPTGIMAVVNGFITFFRAVQSFIEQLTKILQVINTFVQGVGQIARGNIQQAADYLENALARALPVAIAFLANQVGLRGLGRRIGEMVERARELINNGIDWLLDRAISLGRSILNALTGGANAEEGNQHSPETQQRINAGVEAISTEEQRLATNGKISREDADQVAQNIRRHHPVFTSFTVVDGGDSWNYRYTASPEQVVDTPTTKSEGGDNDSFLSTIRNAFGMNRFSKNDAKQQITNDTIRPATIDRLLPELVESGTLFVYQSNQNDPHKRFTLDRNKGGQRIIPGNTVSKRSLFGYSNPIHNSPTGRAVLAKGVAWTKLSVNGIEESSVNPLDWNFLNGRAWFNSMRPGSSHRYSAGSDRSFRRPNAILGHDETQVKGASDHWNKIGMGQLRRDNMDWNYNPASYWGPEERHESSASGSDSPNYEDPHPTKGAHESWWNPSHSEYPQIAGYDYDFTGWQND